MNVPGARLAVWLAEIAFVACGTVGTAAAQTGKIFVDVHEAVAQQKGDDACVAGIGCNEQDFWTQVSFPPFGTWLKSKEIGNRDDASWSPPFIVSEDVSKTQRYHDIQIELWDKDDSTADDRFDITPLAPDTLTVHFDACTNTWEQIGLADVYGPGMAHPPFGTRDPEFNGRVVVDVHTEGRIPFTTNDISLVGLSPVQAPFEPDDVVSGKATAMRVMLASTYTGPTAPAPVTVTVTDGISAWTQTRSVIIPPGLSTFYFFDGLSGSPPFFPSKPPNVDRAFLSYSGFVNYNDVAPSGTAPDFIDCYQANNSIVNKQNPIVRTSSPTVLFMPYDYLDSLPGLPPFSDVQTTAQRDELFRQTIWPLASTNAIVSPLPALWPYDPLSGWLTEPYNSLMLQSIAFGLLGVDRVVLVTRKGWFKDNSWRSVVFPGGSIGLSLGEVGPHAVIAEANHSGVSTHELGHTYKLSRHKCSHGGFKEDVLQLGCRDEYSGDFGPEDGVPFWAFGLDVMGSIFPAGASDTGTFFCPAPTNNTREVCEKNLMDVAGNSDFVNWLDTFTWNYMTETLKQGNDPELVNLSGFVHSLNGFDPSQAPRFEGQLEFSYHTFGIPDLPEPIADAAGGSSMLASGEGRFTVHLATASGDKQYHFTPSFWSEGASDLMDRGYFSFFVPWDPTTRSITLTAPADARITDCESGLCSDVTLFQRNIQPGPPSVSALRAGLDTVPPLTGPAPPPPTVGPGHDVVVAWSAADTLPGPEGLRATLLLSPTSAAGGPSQFVPFSVSNTTSQMRIPHDWLASTPGDYIGQVIVSNGLLSTPLTAGPLFHLCNFSNGGAEVCNGIDDDCDGLVDNAPLPGSEQVSLNPQPFPPGPSAAVQWTADPEAQSYDVVYGALDVLHGTGGDFTASTIGCVANDITGTSVGPVPDPPRGSGYWFLVRGNNCSGPGTYDEGSSSQVGSRDAAINASPRSCPSVFGVP